MRTIYFKKTAGKEENGIHEEIFNQNKTTKNEAVVWNQRECVSRAPIAQSTYLLVNGTPHSGQCHGWGMLWNSKWAFNFSTSSNTRLQKPHVNGEPWVCQRKKQKEEIVNENEKKRLVEFSLVLYLFLHFRLFSLCIDTIPTPIYFLH